MPTPQEVADKMLELAKVTKKDVVYDLGCGDGCTVYLWTTPLGFLNKRE